VIEGDMVGELDADRLRQKGVDVSQISTGRSCHLDAQMVARVLHAKAFSGIDFLFIENVGNLVCPAEFPLGEHKRVVLLSVTEGDDKPIKYPVIFHRCDAVIFTKCDLLPYVNFNIERATKYLTDLNASVTCFTTSAVTGEGIENWLNWLLKQRFVAKCR
jgi:hydrogenase nickel incorporation protein HypB